MKKNLLPAMIGLFFSASLLAQQAQPQVPSPYGEGGLGRQPNMMPYGMQQQAPVMFGAGTQAPVVPAIEPASALSSPSAGRAPPPSEPPPPVNLLSTKDATLTRQEEEDVALAKKYMDGRNLTAAGTNGAVMFTLGQAMPSIVCAPLYVCDVSLQPGEMVNNVLIGDSTRWKVSPATSGAGPSATVHLIIKPADIGLTTNLVVTTDRRTYSLKLVSRKDDYMPAVAFTYPEDESAAWAKLTQQQAAQRAATVLPESGGLHVEKLDFDYELGGDRPAWKPVRVYSDGVKTYIEFPHKVAAQDMPVLVSIADNKKEEMVNYRVKGDRFVVDKVLDRAELLSGVGRHQVQVTIQHTKG